jgi:hypothetical protein
LIDVLPTGSYNLTLVSDWFPDGIKKWGPNLTSWFNPEMKTNLATLYNVPRNQVENLFLMP